MCQWVAYSSVSVRAVHESPTSITLGTVKTRVPGSPLDLLYHSVWGWAIETAFSSDFSNMHLERETHWSYSFDMPYNSSSLQYLLRFTQ